MHRLSQNAMIQHLKFIRRIPCHFVDVLNSLARRQIQALQRSSQTTNLDLQQRAVRHLGSIFDFPEGLGTNLLEKFLQSLATVAGVCVIAVDAGAIPARYRNGPGAGMRPGDDQALKRAVRIHAVAPRQRVYEFPRIISA